MPSGVLLYGPPGTGKTLLARALAGESGMAYFALSASELVEMYVGVGAARVRDIFAKARKNAPALIFMDEIDAIGRSRGRGQGGGGGDDEREATLNQLLVELDGFSPRDNIIFLAATNRKELLDPALLRAGRLQNHIKVDLPGPKGRRDILALHTANKPLADGIDLDRLAADTAGCSGADLSDMVNRAAILAARHDREAITMEDLDEGQLWAIAGPERKESVFGEGEERKVAFHEAGHVVCAEACDTHEKSHRVTIKQRGSAGGLAKYGQVDRILHDRRTLHEQMVCLLGGRAAEKEVFGEVSSGAQNDLQRVTQIGRAAVSELALSEAIGQTVVNGERISEERRALIEREVDELVTSAWVDAQQIVAEHRESLDSLAEALLVQKDMHRVDILSALAGAPITPLPVPTAHAPAAQRSPTKPVGLSDRRRRSGVKDRLGRGDLRTPARRAIMALRGRKQAAMR
jgi:cell division protease FtsH